MNFEPRDYQSLYEEVSKKTNLSDKIIAQKNIDIAVDKDFGSNVSKYVEIIKENNNIIFPVNNWSKYIQIEEDDFIDIWKATPEKLREQFIVELIDITPASYKHNPFLLHWLLYPKNKCHEQVNLTEIEFQTFITQRFIQKIPGYEKEIATFAFMELTKIERYFKPETNSLFNKLEDNALDNFLKQAFHNKFVFSFFEQNNNFFNYLCLGFFDYGNSSRTNKVFDHLLKTTEFLEPVTQNLYQTLFPQEIEAIQRANKTHQYHLLNKDVPVNQCEKKNKLKV